MKLQTVFRSPTEGKMNLAKVAKTVSRFISQDAQSKYRLIVGTDSDGLKEADFVTAIIVYRVGHGGRYFWTKTKNGGVVYHNLRDRIYKEVDLSLRTAQNILDQLGSSPKSNEDLNYDFQIHIDVGQKGPTRDMIKEVVGMVRGNGFEAKIKPESFAASNVADRYA